MVPQSLFETTAAAADVSLVDLATVKSDLGIADTSQDVRLARIIKSVSRRVSGYLGFVAVEQSYRETWRLPSGGSPYAGSFLACDPVRVLPLSARVVTVISSVVEAGVTLASTLYEMVDGLGLRRLDANGNVTNWAGGVVVVSYKAGWIGAKGAAVAPQVALPDDIYEGVIDAVRSEFKNRGRDVFAPIKSETIPDVYSIVYDTGSGADDDGCYGLPDNLRDALDQYARQSMAF